MISDRLATRRLTLRPFRCSDAESVFEYWSSDPSWERFNASVPADFSLADAQSFVKQMMERDRFEAPSWALEHQGTVVGVVSLTFAQNHQIAVLGYGVHGDLRGEGFAGEAANVVIGEAFSNHEQLRLIRAYTDPENQASIRVLEKLGFSSEDTAGQYVLRSANATGACSC